MTTELCRALRTALKLSVVIASIALAQTATVDYVIDGDTFVLTTGERIRLIGIDTPESQDPNKPVEYFSEQSKAYLERLMAGKSIRLEYGNERTDKYGRLLCYAWVGDTLVNLEMVKRGYAMAYLRFPHSMETEFLKAEIAARRAAIGMWASPRSVQPNIDNLSTGDVQKMLDEAGRQPTPQQQPQVAPAPTQPSTQTGKDETVYITKTGSKYHRGNCNYLSKSKIPISKADAIARGYGPCSKCRP